jgi:hypothetical protein
MAKNDLCDICGYDFNVRNSKKYQMSLCKKHYYQLDYNNKITDIRQPKPTLLCNEIILHNDYAEIILYDTYNYEKNRTVIDLEDIEKVNKLKWYSNSHNYVTSTTDKIALHKYLLNNYINLIDHIDNNPLNNRKCNLRIANKSHNAFNVIKLRTNNTSGITGVYYNKLINKWIAAITVNNETIILGSFYNIDDAKQIRKLAEKKYFGDYAPIRKEG